MYDFLSNNRDELAGRCRLKVAARPGRSATELQLLRGVPKCLEQLIRTLRVEQLADQGERRGLARESGTALAAPDIGVSAALHGKELLNMGFSAAQVVHDYADLSASITDLASAFHQPIEGDALRTLKRCLDNAMAAAITEVSHQRNALVVDLHACNVNQRMAGFAQELHDLLGTASMALSATRGVNLNLGGAAGSILESSLQKVSGLIELAVSDVLEYAHPLRVSNTFSLAEFIAELKDWASVSALARQCTLDVPAVDAGLAISGNRATLLSGVANLLQNAIKFTHRHSTVTLSAYAAGERIFIDVLDRCGGLPAGLALTLLEPCPHSGTAAPGAGLGLRIAQQNIAANGGLLSVQDFPGKGCVFTVCLARHNLSD
ncbi:sensor histidine kinase [Oxalobacteraceae bacterium]|nr:sensor histidine kinase [Oxalobacteraceae bacterium]